MGVMNDAPSPITIFVDADACPVKDEIYRVAGRHGLKVLVVANSWMNIPRDPMIERVVVNATPDAADDWIAERCAPGAIVISADIPLAARAVKAGADVIAPNGQPVYGKLHRHGAGDAQSHAGFARGGNDHRRAKALFAARQVGLPVRAGSCHCAAEEARVCWLSGRSRNYSAASASFICAFMLT